MHNLDSMFVVAASRSGMLLAAMILAVSLLAACESSKGSDGANRGSAAPAPQRHSVESLLGRWELESLLGEPITIAQPISLIVGADGSLSGRSAVNGYSALLPMDRLSTGAFEAYPIASTLMAGPPERMELEARYFRGLERATTWSIRDGALLLHDGEVEVARFRRAAE